MLTRSEELVSINPDGMPEEDLHELGRGLRLLADYCGQKARAMRNRAAGKIETALDYERDCDEIYQQLPEWAKSW